MISINVAPDYYVARLGMMHIAHEVPFISENSLKIRPGKNCISEVGVSPQRVPMTKVLPIRECIRNRNPDIYLCSQVSTSAACEPWGAIRIARYGIHTGP